MNRKELLKQLIITFQDMLPVQVISHDLELPLYADKIITVPGVWRCGKSSLMNLAVNRLLADGVTDAAFYF